MSTLLEEAIIFHKKGELIKAENLYKLILKDSKNNFEVTHLIGIIKIQLKQFEEAIGWLNKAILINSNNHSAFNNLGVCYKEIKNYTEASNNFKTAININPNYAEAYNNLAIVSRSLEKYDDAIKNYKKAVQIKPDYAEAYNNLGLLLLKLKDLDGAKKNLEQAIKLKPDYAEAHNSLGLLLIKLKDLNIAKKYIEQAIKLRPGYAEAYSNLGILYNDLGELKKAEEILEYAIKLNPNSAEFYNNISVVYINLDQLEKAKSNLEQAIKLKPNYAVAYATLGHLYLKKNKQDIAKKYFEKGINLKSDSGMNYLSMGTYYENMQEYEKAEIFYRKANFLKEHKSKIILGNLLANTGRHKEADEIYENIINHNQQNAEIYFNKAINFFSSGKIDLAIKNLNFSKKIDPNLYNKKQERLYSILYFKNMICDWDDYEKNIDELIKNLELNYINEANPYIFLTFSDSLELVYKIVKRKSEIHKVNDKRIYINIKKIKAKKINIGYYSSDFKDHPVGNIFSELIKAHDKEKFEISGFNLYNNLNRDKVTDKIIKSLDKYIDLEKKDYKNLINNSKKEKIDIAVDLVGFTAFGNQKAFLERLAPIQINFLGYPGTIGPSHDYIIADKNTIPYKSKKFYFEKIIYLPKFFLPTFTKFNINDNLNHNFFELKKNIKTVFCNFSSFHKISPIIFEAWMKILKNSENSILWLLNADEIIQNNLKKEAQKKNININRIIFSKRLNFNEHTTKYKFCDLYLDTFPYNSHSTATSCIFSGVPLLTIEGEGFQSRVASSLLKNLGLNELICSNQLEYIEKAINLANSPTELKKIKEKLRKSLALNYKIFDMKNYVKNLEEAYLKIYEISSNNLKTTDISIN